MTHVRKRLLAVGLAALALAGVGAAASSDAQARPGKARALQVHALKAAADYLGLTKAQLRAQLPGHSLAQLATAQGKSVDGLEAAIVAKVKTPIDKRQAAGRITSQRAATLLAAVQQRVDTFVNRVFGARVGALRAKPFKAAAGFRRIALRESAEYLGLTRKELRTQLKGTSLAQLAVAKGKTEAGLEAAILEPLAARLTRAKTNGRITAARETAALAALGKRIDAFVARVWK
jgi:lambda repressor-like predicted transcriptional regulator